MVIYENDWLAAVNIDDSYGRRLYGESMAGPCYGTKDRSSDFAVIKGTSAEGMTWRCTPDSKTPVATRLPLLRVQYPLRPSGVFSAVARSGEEAALEGLLRMKQVPEG